MRRSLLFAIAFGCADPDEHAPLEKLPAAEEPLVGEAIPPWAAGFTFTRYTGDIFWFHVNPDGSAYAVYQGGDVGSNACVRLRVAGGRLEAPSIVKANDGRDPTTPTLVRTVDGRYFAQTRRGFIEYERADLCGRDMGGCGGYGSVEACDAKELADRAARWGACPAELADAGVRDASAD